MQETWTVKAIELKETEVKLTIQQEAPRFSVLFLYVHPDQATSYRIGATFHVSVTPCDAKSIEEPGKLELLSPLEAGK